MAHHHLVVHPLVLRQLQVARVRDLTPRMRRITLTGAELGAFHRDGLDLPAFTTPGFDDHIKVIFASDGDVEAVLPTQLDRGIEWPPSQTRVCRDYTPRRFDPLAGELDLDFVLHGHGPASTWAQQARPGAELWFAGPKSSTVVPGDSDWVLLAGDETALPAIGRFLEERPLDTPVRAVITVAHPSSRQDLPVRGDDRVEWVTADPHDEAALAEAVRRVEALPGVPYVWAAAESRALLPLRRYALRELGLARSQVNITGYWHCTDDQSPARAGVGQTGSPLVAWFAVRAALRIGLIDALAEGPASPRRLAERLRIEPARLDVLVAALVPSHTLAQDPEGRVILGRAGEALAEDQHAREHYEGFHAEQILALAELPDALGGGSSAWSRAHGATLRQQASRDRVRYGELVEDAAGLVQLTTGLARRPIWRGKSRIAITGPGALILADTLRPHGRITVVESPAALDALREAADAATPDAFSQSWGAQEVAVTALAVEHRTEDETRELLRELRQAAPTAVLIERLTPDGLIPAAESEGALLSLATLGHAGSPDDLLQRLAPETGWRIGARLKLGWGIECIELIAADPES